MTVAYFDSSALVKLVIDDHGIEQAAQLWDGADAVLTSRVAHPEARAALAAADRSGRQVTPQLETDAADLAEQHALSGFDAIHLASALTIAKAPVVMATWDARLHQAAQAVGMATLPGQL
jgi:predicted nucleic acid-binding protein